MSEGTEKANLHSLLEKAAIKLSLSETREEENELKERFVKTNGMICGVTEIGGTVSTLHHMGKLTSSIVAAALNTGVIQKNDRNIHALLHATLEASNSIFIHNNSNANFLLKVGIVSDAEWIAVAIFGRSSLHPMSEHSRIGLGFMHL